MVDRCCSVYNKLSKPSSSVSWSEWDRKSESATALRDLKAFNTKCGEDSAGESKASNGDITSPAKIGETKAGPPVEHYNISEWRPRDSLESS